MAHELLVYGAKGSPFVRKVQVLLAEKGVPYDIEGVMPFGVPDWYAEINPAKRIPTLRDRSVGTEGPAGTIPDSSAICAYIERKHPEPALYPSGAFDYGRALWFEEFGDSELGVRVGLGIFRPFVLSKFMNQERDIEASRKTLHETLPPLFDYLNRQIEGREFLVGDSFSIADIGIATHFVNLKFAGGSLDAARWPALHDFVERILARPSFAACIEDEKKIIPQSEVTL